uniref:Golgi associated, gamma adaptin ear containing, ARF binding protein 3 n=1 Tax=Gadus morhua TaxID=8049 RepID=A0A8C5CX96_GADMO
MAYQEGDSLESWLNKATHPTNRQEDWEYIIGFCDQINKELEGPQIAVKLLIHKIHSPQEWEASQGLTVLEACMKNCGRRFHNEVGKYRFLNELIKLVSPKYMGDNVSEKVKAKTIEMLYSWTVAFPGEAKISEAYDTLRRQGLVTADPKLPLDKTLIPSPPTRPKNPVFENEDMGKVRTHSPTQLCQDFSTGWTFSFVMFVSGCQDDARVQKVTKRVHTLEEVSINVKLLAEMLSHYDQEHSNDSDREIIKELYERCDKLRRATFKMATETEDNDMNLGEILQASDDLSRVINSYRKIVEGQRVNGETEDIRPTTGNRPEGTSSKHHLHPHNVTIFVKYFLILTLSHSLAPSFSALYRSSNCNSPPAYKRTNQTIILGASFGMPAAVSGQASNSSAMAQVLHPGSPAVSQSKAQSLGSAPGSPLFHSMSPGHPPLPASPSRGPEVSLASVHVPLEAIRPSKVLPLTAYDKDGMRVLLNFAADGPPGRPDVLVMVVSMLNTAPVAVQNMVLQAAVPKSMKVKLQPPSGTELAAFNPIFPPASITQIMLLANPAKEKVRLRYKLGFTLGEHQCNEAGEIDQFPPTETWGHL